MWRPLDKIVDLIPEHKWKHFRKWRFDIRYINKDDYNDRWTDYSKGIRLGKVYKNYNDTVVNIVPIATPARWFPGSPEELEVFISDEQYRTKVLPIILSE